MHVLNSLHKWPLRKTFPDIKIQVTFLVHVVKIIKIVAQLSDQFQCVKGIWGLNCISFLWVALSVCENDLGGINVFLDLDKPCLCLLLKNCQQNLTIFNLWHFNVEVNIELNRTLNWGFLGIEKNRGDIGDASSCCLKHHLLLCLHFLLISDGHYLLQSIASYIKTFNLTI